MMRRVMQWTVLLIWAVAWGIALWRWACFGEHPNVPLVLNAIFGLALGILTWKDVPLIIEAIKRKRNNNA